MTPVAVGAFRGVASFPLRVALDQGRFTGMGLEPSLSFTGSSDALITSLLDGALDVAQASPDNFVAWRQRTGRPIVAWYGGSSGPISLVVGPDVGSIEELRGRPIAVDYPNTGWAPILLRILGDHGIPADEVTQVPTGATAKVFDALVSGRSPAAMLNEPWATRATSLGCRVVADHREVAPRLLTSAGASLAPWLAEHHETARRFLGAVVQATTWILDPAEHSAVIALLADHLGVPVDEAGGTLRRLTETDTGWPPDARVDAAGIAAHLDLRASVGDPPSEVADAYVSLVIEDGGGAGSTSMP